MFCCLALDPASPSTPGALEALARACSPRIELHGETAVVFDASGLGRVLGPPDRIGAEVRRLAADHGLSIQVALASTMTTAWVMAHARPGISVVAPGEEAATLAALSLPVLRCLPDSTPVLVGHLSLFGRWGLRTLGDLARLPRADVRTRLGPTGVRLHEAACGEDPAPLVPSDEPRRFLERLELEWPIEGLEPLSFVLGRLCDALSIALERADRGAVAITTRLHLVTRLAHHRFLTLPAPMRDARVLRTLVLLDLESHPPDAAIDVVEIELDVTPGRIAQGSLLTYTLPTPENLATLIARLHALMGESRVGAPKLIDTHDERAVAMQPFSPNALPIPFRCVSDAFPMLSRCSPDALPMFSRCPPDACLRRFRLPIPARVVTEQGAPTHVEPSARGLPASRVLASAGPWRSSGRWWALDRTPWDRDEWDVELTTGIFRLARDRTTGHWEIEGAMD